MKRLVVIAAVIALLFGLVASAEAGRKGSLIETITSRLGTDSPAIGRPAIGVPAIGRPAVGVPAIGVPAIGRPAVGEPAVGEPAVGEPAISKPVIGKPAERWLPSTIGHRIQGGPVLTDAVGVPAIGKPAVGVPAVGEPDKLGIAAFGGSLIGGTTRSKQVGRPNLIQ